LKKHDQFFTARFDLWFRASGPPVEPAKGHQTDHALKELSTDHRFQVILFVRVLLGWLPGYRVMVGTEVLHRAYKLILCHLMLVLNSLRQLYLISGGAFNAIESSI